MINLLTYIKVYLLVSIINVVPAFMPPTWIVLSLYRIHNDGLSTVLLALTGALGSTTGRAIMYKYSGFIRRFMKKERLENLDDLKGIISKDWKEVFVWSSILSLSPIPSNMMFIGGGIVNVDLVPLLAGFFIGRFISYMAMVYVSTSIFYRVEYIYDNAKLLFDLIGIALAFAIIFIDWDKTVEKIKKLKQRYHFRKR